MTKSNELQLLDAFIEKLGCESYLGPWLTEYRGQIERGITSDQMMGLPLPTQAYRESQAILKEAYAKANEIETTTKERLDRQTQECLVNIKTAKERARNAIRKAADDAAGNLW